jgi:hypothetical protein
MLTDDECYELWRAGGHSLLHTLQLIYKTGYDDGQIDMVNQKISDEDFEEIKE